MKNISYKRYFVGLILGFFISLIFVSQALAGGRCSNGDWIVDYVPPNCHACGNYTINNPLYVKVEFEWIDVSGGWHKTNNMGFYTALVGAHVQGSYQSDCRTTGDGSGTCVGPIPDKGISTFQARGAMVWDVHGNGTCEDHVYDDVMVLGCGANEDPLPPFRVDYTPNPADAVAGVPRNGYWAWRGLHYDNHGALDQGALIGGFGDSGNTRLPVRVANGVWYYLLFIWQQVPDQYTLTVNKDGTGGGTVTDDQNFTYASGASKTFNSGNQPTLTATPNSNSTFAGWSSDCAAAGTNSSVIVTMDGNKTCKATFTAIHNTCPVPTVSPTSVKQGDPVTIQWNGGSGTISSVNLNQSYVPNANPANAGDWTTISGVSTGLQVVPYKDASYTLTVNYTGGDSTSLTCPGSPVTVTVKPDKSGSEKPVPPR